MLTDADARALEALDGTMGLGIFKWRQVAGVSKEEESALIERRYVGLRPFGVVFLTVAGWRELYLWREAHAD